MDYMARHGVKRSRPAELVPGTLRVITVRMNYTPPAARDSWSVIHDGAQAFISRYATGRDYHKVLRNRLQQLAERIQAAVGEYRYRVFTDSAPVMEVALAEKAGLGWRGKHTLLLNREGGSAFFLGEIYTDLPIAVPAIEPVTHTSPPSSRRAGPGAWRSAIFPPANCAPRNSCPRNAWTMN